MRTHEIIVRNPLNVRRTYTEVAVELGVEPVWVFTDNSVAAQCTGLLLIGLAAKNKARNVLVLSLLEIVSIDRSILEAGQHLFDAFFTVVRRFVFVQHGERDKHI